MNTKSKNVVNSITYLAAQIQASASSLETLLADLVMFRLGKPESSRFTEKVLAVIEINARIHGRAGPQMEGFSQSWQLSCTLTKDVLSSLKLGILIQAQILGKKYHHFHILTCATALFMEG